MLFVDFTKQEQSGIGGDVTTGEVGFNLTARGVARRSVFQVPFWIAAVGAWWIG